MGGCAELWEQQKVSFCVSLGFLFSYPNAIEDQYCIPITVSNQGFSGYLSSPSTIHLYWNLFGDLNNNILVYLPNILKNAMNRNTVFGDHL